MTLHRLDARDLFQLPCRGKGLKREGVDLLLDRELLEFLEVAEKGFAIADFHPVNP